MKKIYTYITLIVLAALAAGCTKELAQDEVLVPVTSDIEADGMVTVQLSVPDSPETKTTLGTKDGYTYPLYWSDGDGAYLSLNGTAATSSTKNSITQYTATFKPASGLSVFNFLYRGVSGRDDQVTFPASQSFVLDGFDSASMPMYAASASRSNSVTFNHLGALLKFSLTCNDTDHLPANKGIDAVTLTAEDENMSLSGTFTIGKTSNLLNGTLTPASGGNSLTYSFGTHKSLSSTPFVFYVAIPAGTYEGGIKLTIVDNNGGSMDLYVMTEAAKKTIAAGTVREFETVEYVPASEANLIMIYDDASFLKFVNAVAAGRKTVNARVTKNTSPLTLKPETVAEFTSSIQGYKGIFDGNNKEIAGLDKPLFDDLQGTVKNLTLNSTISVTDASDYQLGIFAKTIVPSSEVDDDPGLQNCTANGSVNFTPSSELSNQPSIGGLVGYNKGGVISNCTNNATVAFGDDASVTHTGDRQPAIGGVVARTKGGAVISNSTNAGTVSCAEQFGGNIYIGGTIGFSEAKADVISGCTNSGLVKVLASGSTDKALHIGGVIGLGKCTIETCSNLAAGVVTAEACSVGTYLCQGGVIGRMSATSGTYSGLSNAGTVNVAATGASTQRHIGGVAGRCNEGAAITEFTNSGNINYTAVDANETWIGGIVACSTNHALTSCNSTGGTLTYSGATTDGALYVGGVVGYSTKDITSCSNAMTLNITGTMSCTNNTYKGFGGVVGHETGANIAVTNCTNSGAINYGQTITDEGQTYVGGLVGVLTKGEISGGGNSGTFTFTGQNTKRTPSIGGVVGRVMSNDTESGYALSNNVTNSGAIVLNSSVSSSQYLYVGGLVGQHAAGNIYGTNSGSITVTEAHASVAALGGLVGYMQGGAIVSGSANTATGDIALNGWQITYHSYVGGIAGLLGTGVNPFAAGGGTITGASNAGDITFGSGCSVTRCNFIGGVTGYAGAAISSSSNSGNIVNNYSQTASASGGSAAVKDLCIGGITGVSDAALTSCYNTGNVTNNGSTYNVEIDLGGVVGIVNSGNLTSCSNGTNSLAGGTISNTATSGTNSRQDMQVGGIIGNNKGGNTITSCFNKGEVTNSGLGAKISIGGLAGWSSASTTYTSTCYNTGFLTNTGTGSSNPGLCMGGLLGVARGANTLTGTASVYNYNQSVIVDDSETLNVAVGGICGYSDNAPSSFNYCKSLVPDSETDYDDIEIKNNTKNKVYVGGILGMSAVASTLDYTYNKSDIKFTSLTITETGQVFGGGIIGGWTASGEQTITGCENGGWVYTKASAGDLAVADSEAKPKYWSCFAGIAGMGAGTSESLGGGWNTITGKTFTNCTNTGTVRIYAALRCCIAGVVAYTENNPDGCVSTASDIRPYLTGGISQVGNNYHRNICGGVVGLCTASKVSNLKSTAKIVSQSSSPFAYTGGILGYVPEGSIELENCKVSNHVQATGSGDGRSALMCHVAQNAVTVTFTNCVVKNGTISYSTGKKVTISSSNLSALHCVGPGSNYTITNDVLPTVASSI